MCNPLPISNLASNTPLHLKIACVCVSQYEPRKSHTHTNPSEPFQMEQAWGKPREEQQTSPEQQIHPYRLGKVVDAVTEKGGHVVTSHNPVHNIESLRDKTALKCRAQTRAFRLAYSFCPHSGDHSCIATGREPLDRTPLLDAVLVKLYVLLEGYTGGCVCTVFALRKYQSTTFFKCVCERKSI